MMIQIYFNERVDNINKILEDNDFHGFRTKCVFIYWSCILWLQLILNKERFLGFLESIFKNSKFV